MLFVRCFGKEQVLGRASLNALAAQSVNVTKLEDLIVVSDE